MERLQKGQPRRSKREKKDRRVAAKETRIRKKMYVELLERKIEILERKLSESKKARVSNSGTIGTLLKEREALFNSLSESISKREPDKIKDCIDLLQFRYGIAGKERVKAIEELFDEVVSLLMPMHMRILIELPHRFKAMCRSLPVDRIQRLEKETKFIEQAKGRYSECLAKLHETKEGLLKLNCFYQDVTNKIREALGNKEIGMMLSTIDIERSKNQDYTLLFPMSYWSEINNPEEREDNQDRVNLLNDSLELADLPFSDKEMEFDEEIPE